MYCGLSVLKQSHTKSRVVCEDRERICFAFVFACVVGKNLKTPKLSPLADDAITRGSIGISVSTVEVSMSINVSQ